MPRSLSFRMVIESDFVGFFFFKVNTLIPNAGFFVLIMLGEVVISVAVAGVSN